MKSTIPLRRYLSVQLGIVAALPVILIALLGWQFLIPHMRTTIGLHHHALARAIAGQISAYLMGGERQLVSLARYLNATGLPQPWELVPLLDAQCGDGAFFETIYAVDHREPVVYSVGLAQQRRYRRDDLMGMNLSGREFLERDRQLGRAVWSETFLSTVSGQLAVALTVPIADTVVVGEMTLNQLSEFISHLPAGTGLFTMVVDRQGRVVADSERVRWGQVLDISTLPISSEDNQATTGSHPFRLDDLALMGTVVEVTQLGWKVLVAQHSHVIFRPVRAALMTIVIGLGVALVLALAVAFLRAGSISQQVAFYTHQAKAIARGEYALTWPSSRTTEFRHLGDNLQAMARTISLREEQLMASEKRLNDLVANVPGVVFQFRSSRDHKYSVEYLSQKTVAILGLSADPHDYMRGFYACIPEDERPDYIRSIRDAVDSVGPWNYEGRFNRPDGRRIWFSGNAVPHRDGDGIVYYGVLMDITDRKQAVEELRRLRNYLSNIINSMPSVLVGVDDQGRVIQWNKQAERYTGLPLEKAQSQPLTDVFPQLADEMARIQAAIRDRQVLRDLKRPRSQQGETRFEDLIIFPLVTNGVEGAVIRVDDVTERVRLEEMMIQSEKMLSIGGLAAGMAHEINNPLAGILQNTAVLESRLMGDLPANHQAAVAAGTSMEAMRRYLNLRKLPGMLDNIRESGNRAAAIVTNMLSFARKSERVVSSNDLGVLLDQTIELVRTDYDMKKHYDFKQIRMNREYDEAAPAVPCESSKLQQVFLNILKNGAEAMTESDGAERTPTFTLRVRDDGPWVRVEIEDNGPGMGEETRRRIFEPFFTTKPAGQGTGLGLSVSYFIVTEDHDGEMTVEAVEGGGSRFVIRLPKGGKTSV